jgi:hypothetical protein
MRNVPNPTFDKETTLHSYYQSENTKVYKEIYGIGVYKLENNKPLPLPEGHSGVNDVYGGWPWKSLEIQDNKKTIDVYLRRCYECPNVCAVTDAKNLLEEIQSLKWIGTSF